MEEEKTNEQIVEKQELSAEQIIFNKLISDMTGLELEKDDIVIFRNNSLGRIDGIFIDTQDLIYRIYVKITNNIIVTLDENFKNTENDVNYDAVRIISSDFTRTKKEIKLEDLVLTKEQAQEELSNLKGQNIIIE